MAVIAIANLWSSPPDKSTMLRSMTSTKSEGIEEISKRKEKEKRKKKKEKRKKKKEKRKKKKEKRKGLEKSYQVP
jgi:hypothetical protein